MPELTDDDARLAQGLRAAFAGDRPDRLGVAVSGGGDSTALLHLLHDWSRDGGPALAAVTVDHGLRPEAAAEASAVASACAALGIPHDTLRWTDAPKGNLMQAAREARLGLISHWARDRGIGAVALGHTADDQAETFLMRLARGSGVDGLSGMAARRSSHGIDWLRPLLFARRAELRGWLQRRGLAWAEDPTNEDADYLRVRARQALATLDPLGIGVERILETQALMALARDALDSAADRAARDLAEIEAGEVVLRREACLALPQETQLRLFARALGWVTGTPYRPRLDSLMRARQAVLQGRRATLGGCLVTATPDALRFGRELRACGAAVRPGRVWDNRWIVTGPDSSAEIRALGAEGLAQLPRWREAGLPRTTLLASPAVWQGGRLVAAPLARPGAEWRANPVRDPLSFFTGRIAH